MYNLLKSSKYNKYTKIPTRFNIIHRYIGSYYTLRNFIKPFLSPVILSINILIAEKLFVQIFNYSHVSFFLLNNIFTIYTKHIIGIISKFDEKFDNGV